MLEATSYIFKGAKLCEFLEMNNVLRCMCRESKCGAVLKTESTAVMTAETRGDFDESTRSEVLLAISHDSMMVQR